MTIQEFKTHIEEELRHKLKGNNEATPILDRLDKHLTDFEGYDLTDLLNPKNMKHDLYVSFLFQICFPSRIKMEIDAEYTPIKRKRIAVMSCKSKKKDYVCSADEMYGDSHIYKAQKNFFIKGYDDYYILSTKYGIIHHSHIIEPYNIALGEFGNYISEENQSSLGVWGEEELTRIEKQIGWMVKQGWSVDLHTSLNYYKPLTQTTKDNVRYVKQPRGANSTKPVYDDATDLLDSKSLDECLEFISEKKATKYPEYDKWFYHPIHGKFYGKSLDLYRKFPGNNPGNLFKTSVGLAPQQRGWVIDESLLDKLYQTDSGQWRLKK